MQTSKQDKQWQIREMYRMYTFAIVCIVVPSGLRFLVSFAEETQWIHRAWTLQEVVAPPSVAVLFSWNHGDGEALARLLGETYYGRIEVVTRGRSAMAGLGNVLTLCAGGCFEFTPDDADTAVSPLLVEAALFGQVQSHADAGALTVDNHIAFPHITALGFAIDRNLDTEEMRDFCIWQCALVRTSSRPVDMIFSIMGILGVILDPKEFADDDRLGATIALAREILRQGRSANWLAMHITIPPCPQLSTFPTLPRTSVAGRAMYDLPSGGEQTLVLADAVYPNDIGLFPPLKGSMDGSGYLSFHARAFMVVTAPEAMTLPGNSPYDNPVCPTQLRAMDGSKWTIMSDDVGISMDYEHSASPLSLSQEPRSFAVILGWYNDMPAETNGDNIRAMLITEHTNGLYHVRSYFVLSHEAIQWASTRTVQHFCVGGPE
ncbi:Integral membrane protein [Mycena sanguinolenta]|uniref:Integral membrane protein n=1 Tax=Mycena sanguinolenta TaxID=230812 RepID=A0A8H7CSD9_9AGAR|nr:Integral membrane protein [Mycena sanguinolenta]